MSQPQNPDSASLLNALQAKKNSGCNWVAFEKDVLPQFTQSAVDALLAQNSSGSLADLFVAMPITAIVPQTEEEARAILADISGYVRAHGIDVNASVQYKYCSMENGDKFDHTLLGDLVSLALILKDETAVLRAIEAGVEPAVFAWDSEGFDGWHSETVHPIWTAAKYGFNEAVKSLFATDIDYAWQAKIISDEAYVFTLLEPLMERIQSTNDVRNLLTEVGWVYTPIVAERVGIQVSDDEEVMEQGLASGM